MEDHWEPAACQRVRHALPECPEMTRLRRELRRQKMLNVVLAEKLADIAEKLARVLAKESDAPARSAP